MANIPYIQATCDAMQLIQAKNVPQKVLINIIDESNDMALDVATGEIKANKDGKYVYILGAQVGRVGVGQQVIPNIRIWVKKNGVDVPNSNVLNNINYHRFTKDVLVNNGIITLKKDDKLSFSMTSNVDAEARLEYYAAKTGEPAIPSVILTMYKLGIESDDLL